MPISKGSSNGRVGSGRQSTRGAAKAAWKQLPQKAQRQIVVGTGFNLGVAGVAGVSMRGGSKANAAAKKQGSEGPKKSMPAPKSTKSRKK